jgi:hypothetical protein
LITSHLSLFVPLLFERAKDKASLPAKMAAERALFHTLQIKQNPAVVQNYLQKVDPSIASALDEYVKRILSKLPEQSDDEEEDT